MLAHALEGVTSQIAETAFSFEIVVVDNDSKRSAEDIVRSFQKNKDLHIIYDCEPEQNIALARNRAIKNGIGNLIAFIDDDEFPEPTWLLNLYRTLISSKADGVLGPVIPHFETKPPQWIIKSKILERPSFKTGTVLRAGHTRTGNVLLKRSIFELEKRAFDPKFGRTGGEDGDFFRRMIDKGHTFVWCNEAPVYETIPPERFKRSYFIKRAIMRGVSEVKLNRWSKIGVIKSIIGCSIYTLILPFLLIFGHHLFMKCLIKDFDHISKLLALCGIEMLKERNF